MLQEEACSEIEMMMQDETKVTDGYIITTKKEIYNLIHSFFPFALQQLSCKNMITSNHDFILNKVKWAQQGCLYDYNRDTS